MNIHPKLKALASLVSRGFVDEMLRGLEKEHLRVDANGYISQRKHPKALGSPLTHPNITLDFSESLIEMVTHPVNDIGQLAKEITSLTQWVAQNLEDNELLWAGSMPGFIPQGHEIALADFGKSNKARINKIYRNGLVLRYGKIMQIIAGLHYNLSFPDSLFEVLKKLEIGNDSNLPLTSYRSDKYMSVIRHFFCYSWSLPYFFGSAPAGTQQSLRGKYYPFAETCRNSVVGKFATSLRLSPIGYKNHEDLQLNISYNSVEDYVSSLKRATQKPFEPFAHFGVKNQAGDYVQLNTNCLQNENEFYNFIRPKQIRLPNERAADALSRAGVAYLETRFLDLHPDYITGQNLEAFAFIDVLLFYCLLHDNTSFDCAQCDQAWLAFDEVVMKGRAPGLTIEVGEKRSLAKALHTLLDNLMPVADFMDNFSLKQKGVYTKALEQQRGKIDFPARTPSATLLEEFLDSTLSYHEWMLEKTKALHVKIANLPPLSEEVRKAYVQDIALSKQQFQEIENTPEQDFEAYIKRYTH